MNILIVGGNMEKIQSHEIKDIWRIKDGLLVEIWKYEHQGWIGFSNYKSKIVRGCKGLKMLKEDYKQFKTGDYVYGSAVVNPTIDVKKFKAEIKSSGGSVLGSLLEINDVLNDIKNILSKYE
jgi:hypothetical protein